MADGSSGKWLAGTVAAAIILLGAGIWLVTAGGGATTAGTLPDDLVPIIGQPETEADREALDPEAEELWARFVSRPDGPPRISTGLTDELGREVSVSCASCHANMDPNPRIRSADDLADFHHGLAYDHGNMSCLSCHNADNYNTLRLADGSAVDYPDVQHMCSQCHAPEARDFARGVHGGMTGYWDRTRGPQTQKSCIDCHDPHKPAFPRMTPDFKPRDRFLEPH